MTEDSSVREVHGGSEPSSPRGPRGFDISFAFHSAPLWLLKEAALAQNHMTLPALLSLYPDCSEGRLCGVLDLGVHLPSRRIVIMGMVRF